MFEAFLRSTSSEGLQPLGSAPQRSFELISAAVRERLGDAHGDLFAEPVAAQHGDTIDWYAPMQGAAVALPDLPEDEQAQVRARLAELVSGIRAEAQTLADSDAPDDQRLSEALLNAIEVPGEDMVQVVRGLDGGLYPVLVHWAWLRDEQAEVRGVLTSMVARPGGSRSAEQAAIAAQQQMQQQEQSRLRARAVWWWLLLLGWVLLLVLLGWILYLLIAPCGVNQGRLIFCPKPEPEISAVLGEARVIEDEIAGLEHEMALLDRGCKPTIPVLPATPKVAPAPGSAPDTNAPAITPTDKDRAEIDKRIRDRGAARGVLNFVLEWQSVDDVDLYVTCPNGATISYRNKTDCNATYDLDANVLRKDAITDPAENIVFNELHTGLYKVRAHLRGHRTDRPVSIVLHVLRADGNSQSFTGILGSDQKEWTKNITISR